MDNKTIFIGFTENYEMVASHRPIDCALGEPLNIDITPEELEGLKAGHALAVYCPLRGWSRQVIIIKDEKERNGAIYGASIITAEDHEPANLDAVRFIE